MGNTVNKNIIGTGRNDSLVNKNTRGFTFMNGLGGNDTYSVNNIAKTFTSIEDTQGFSKLNIAGIKGNDLGFWFDVSKDSSMDSTPFADGLIIVKKSMINSVVTQLRDFILSYETKIPQSGAIEYYFSNGNWQKSVRNISSTGPNGIKYTFNLINFANTVIPNVRNYLNTTIYSGVTELVMLGNSSQIAKLINIYKNTPINYTVVGSAKKDTIALGNGNDIIYGKNGNDIIKGGRGNDTLVGGKGSDKLYFQAGNNTATFEKGDGKDTVYKGTGSDTLLFKNFASISKLKSGLKMAKSGNNLVMKYTSKDNVTLYNYFKNNTSVTTLKAKSGSVSLESFFNSYIFNTYNGKKNKVNNINGSSLNDLIKGNNKNDTLSGFNGNDKIYGYAGNDVIKAGAGNDIVDGGAGNDTIYGQAGTNTLKGNAGNDKIYGGTGVDYIYCGAGNDYTDGGNGNDVIYGQSGKNILKGGAGNDRIYGGTGVDYIYCGAGNDYTDGGNGNDVIYGQSGKNILKGGAGNDRIYAGAGTDNIDGGAGDDIFIISSLGYSANITDTAGTDILNINAAKSDIKILFNVKKDGTFAEGDDKLYLTNAASYDNWKTTGILPTNGVVVNGFNPVETINSFDNYKIADLNTLKNDVAAWLTDNGGYSDVTTAITSGNDMTGLIAIFDSNTNWQYNAV